jgi:hypothetical protein
MFAIVHLQEIECENAQLFPSCRLTLAIIGFFMFVHLYAQRVGMSVAIVCMVNHTAVRLLHDSSHVTSDNISLLVSADISPYAIESSNISTVASEEQTSTCIQRQHETNDDGKVCAQIHCEK